MKGIDNCYSRKFPQVRLRRLRRTPSIRELFQETRLSVSDLVCPLFIEDGIREPQEIESMPGIFRLPLSKLSKNVDELFGLGIKAFIIFGIPSKKDKNGRGAYNRNGIAQRSIELLRNQFTDKIVLISDVCLCQYTEHGHCGIIKAARVDNEMTLQGLSNVALSHAESGVDFVAPSAMMDGQVYTIRKSLDASKFTDVGIIAYSAKYSSNLYSPFRYLAKSRPKYGDRRSYQMAYTNKEEAMQEIKLDIEEGADAIMIKPAIPYLDLIANAKKSTLVPICAFSVSGEYAMIKAAAMEGHLNENETVTEFITCIKRAGADIVITYHAKKMAELLLR
ncbi:MAG TPA: porphobilinogen synthase [Nitrososphaeraceae archaeon]